MVNSVGCHFHYEEVFEHKPFAVIGDALAKQGIATLRYDDRGFGESKGDLENISIILIIIADYTKMRNADLYNWNIDSLSENIISTLPVPCKEVFLPYRRKTS